MRLKEVIISANTGLDAIKRAPIVEENTGIKCVRIQDISQKKEYDDWGNTLTTEKDYKNFKLEINDLLVARTGATVGVSYLVKKDYNAVFNNGSIRLRLNDTVNTRFVYYIFQTNSFKQYIDNVSCVATQPNLRVENLLRFSIPDIEKITQDLIVSGLEKFDDLIECNVKRIKVLEEMAENLYKEWFVRFRFSGYESYSFLSGVPKEWKLCKLQEIIKIDRGLSYTSEEIEGDEGVDLINLKNIQSYGGYRYDGTKKYNGKYKQEQVVKVGDLVMGVTDMTQERRTVGSVAMIPIINNTSVISADLIKITSDINTYFLYSMFKYGSVSRYISQFANGANVLHLRPQSINRVKVYIPTKDIIEKYSLLVQPIFEEVNVLNEKVTNLIKQRELLLPRLMSGKLEIK